ncbi:TonB family protein [Nitrospira sp. T9]|uniref:energy transducer TonB n=1 Tax=unclassified Nitrospira TaxID=2652172 RepID=UPI003F9972E4
MTLATLEALSVAPDHCRVQAWAGSTFVHILFVSLAILLITDLQPTSQSEPLKLDMAFIKPAPPKIHNQPVPQELPKPTPVHQQVVPEKVPLPTPVQQPMTKREPVIEEHKPLPTKKTQEVLHTDTVPMPRQEKTPEPVQAKPILESTPIKQEIVSEPAKHILSPSTHSKSVEQVKPVMQRETSLTQQAEPSPQALPTPLAEVRERVDSPMQTTLVAERVTESVPTTRPEASVQSQAIQTKAEVVEPTVPIAQEKKIARERPAPRIHQRTAAVERPIQSYPEAQADYGWLAQTIWHQIEKYKSYPREARQNEWEGKVVLEAVIRQDGTILHLRVAETSGHEILDKDALSLLWKLSPLTLNHALGHPQITILVPLTYKLDG